MGGLSQLFESSYEKKQNKKQHTAVMVRSFGTSEDATKDYKWSKWEAGWEQKEELDSQ